MNDRLDLVSFLQGLLFGVCCIGWGVISYTSAYSGSFEDSAIVIITLLLISALIAFVGYLSYSKKGVLIVLGAMVGSALLGLLPFGFEAIEDRLAARQYYTQACQYYENGDLRKAGDQAGKYLLMDKGAQRDKELDFIQNVFLENQAELQEETLQKAHEQYRIYQEKLDKGVPFVGMMESDLGKTHIGYLDGEKEIDFDNYEYLPWAYLYHYVNTKKQLLMTVRCRDGVVTNVYDYRDKPLTTKPPFQTYHSSSSSSDDDPYNARDYVDAWDFYEDNYDDFDNFEDAEMYYYNKNR